MEIAIPVTGLIAELLKQTIGAVVAIIDATSIVNNHSSELEKRRKVLSDLRDTLKVIQDEKDFQTPNVIEKLQSVHAAATRVQAFIDKLMLEITKPKIQQVVRQVFQGGKNGRDWDTALAELDRAKADLFIVVILASVSSAMHRGGAPASRQAVAAAIQTEIVVRHQRAMTYLHGIDPSVSAVSSTTVTDTGYPEKEFIRNCSKDQAVQILGDVGEQRWELAVRAVYRENVARDRSLQIAGNISGASFNDILAARRSG